MRGYQLPRRTPAPRPTVEPQGLGAVVVDDDGTRWVRFTSRTGWWWRNPAGRNRRWPDVAAARVLSYGVPE